MTLDDLNDVLKTLKAGERLALENIPAHIYHASNGIGSTAMYAACQSMAHYRHYVTTDKEPTPDMIIGTVTHALVLEPETLLSQVAIVPSNLTPGNNGEYQTWKSVQTLPIISQENAQLAGDMAKSIDHCVGEFFGGGKPEVSYWLRDKYSGLILKARGDYVLQDGIIDLKTTRVNTPMQFLAVVRDRYAIQEALYRRVTGLADMIYVGVSKEPPHQCFMCKQGEDVRQKAENKINAALDAIIFADEFQDYPLPPVEILTSSLRPWD